MSNLSCGTHVAEPSANKDCRKLLNQFCRFLPKLKLPISADAKLPLTAGLAYDDSLWLFGCGSVLFNSRSHPLDHRRFRSWLFLGNIRLRLCE